ncbi:MAG: hypothetical protein FJX74_22030 [Armatimonadetes bacterium]|nr:hypothetical protein [Armatimonadota bacterium]
MELLYKDDWPAASERLRAFWANSAVGRAAIGVTAPRAKPLPGPPSPPPPSDLLARWTDPEYLIEGARASFRSTLFGGEAVPSLFVNLGPGIIAAYLGSEPAFAETTVWFGELPDFDWARPPQFHPANSWWQTTRTLTQACAEALAGEGLVGITDLGGGSDVLAALRGTENLLLDLVTHPECVGEWMDHLARLWCRLFDELYSLTRDPLGGSLQWLALWAPGTMYNIASDFSCMVSPAMFDRFIAPELEALCRHLDFSLYHLDGPDAARHLDRLLAIPELGGIQWTPGAGVPQAAEWLPMLRSIQARGKRLHVHEAFENAERVLRGLKPEGLFLQTHAPTEAAALELLEKATAWAAGPRQS